MTDPNGQPQDKPTQVGELDVEVSGQNLSPVHELPLEEQQEDNALFIASRILWFFAGSLTFSFVIIIMLLLFSLKFPDTILTKLVPALDNFTRLIQVIGALFSPLLAFILGFYFSGHRRKRRDD